MNFTILLRPQSGGGPIDYACHNRPLRPVARETLNLMAYLRLLTCLMAKIELHGLYSKPPFTHLL